jgi:hypothetical protein
VFNLCSGNRNYYTLSIFVLPLCGYVLFFFDDWLGEHASINVHIDIGLGLFIERQEKSHY